MTRETLVILLAGGAAHAAKAGQRVALCGVIGAPLISPVRGAFDVSCDACGDRVVQMRHLTPLSDPTNVDMRTTHDEEER